MSDQRRPVIAVVAIQLDGTPGARGEGSLAIPYLIPPEFAGHTLYEQAYIFDAGAPNLVKAQTNGHAVTFGF